MPTPMIKTFASKSGKSVNAVEKIWKETKQELLDSGKHKEGDENFYPILVSIIKKKLHLKEMFLEKY